MSIAQLDALISLLRSRPAPADLSLMPILSEGRDGCREIAAFIRQRTS